MKKNLSILIVDYGVGNTYSLSNALNFLGYKKIKISDKEQHIREADALILPGVGAFAEASRNLRMRMLHLILGEAVLVQRKPILGICLGMQMLAEGSEENGWNEGLNWIPGIVKKLQPPSAFSVPQVGWNNVFIHKKEPLFTSTSENPNFYFDHSYHFETTPTYRMAWCDYGMEVTAAVNRDNIFGVQFHPEKSQSSGLKLFRGFFNAV
jgi:glutamine amidotransferase